MRFLREATFDCSNLVSAMLFDSYAAFAASSDFCFITNSPIKSALSGSSATRVSRFATSFDKRAISEPLFC